jgi:hypothetical protein
LYGARRKGEAWTIVFIYGQKPFLNCFAWLLPNDKEDSRDKWLERQFSTDRNYNYGTIWEFGPRIDPPTED